jgi:YidC/Oxa1 family membrane protein insertase
MDQRRLFITILASIGIMVGWQYLVRPYLPHPPAPPPPVAGTAAPAGQTNAALPTGAVVTGNAAQAPVSAEVPRLPVSGTKVSGSISLLGARIDDLVLDDYRDTLAPDSPKVHLLAPRGSGAPYFAQYGWSAPQGSNVKVPDDSSVWTASAPALHTGQPVTLSWDNGAGLTFQIKLSLDDHYMFAVQQSVKNTTGQPVTLLPYQRIRREYEPESSGYYVLFEGLIGVSGGTVHEMKYTEAKSTGDKAGGVAYENASNGGWAGFTDKYWLAALIPDDAQSTDLRFVHNDSGYQIDYHPAAEQSVPPGGEASTDSHLFAGAKVVSLLSAYETNQHIALFDYAVDWGWFWFITRPFFAAIDWIYAQTGNFGVAILVFTVCVKALFFPLANFSYRSMGRMKLLAPKIAELKERFKDDPQKQQSEMMQLYKAEKVNPASGCLPMLLQIPVFFSLYKVIFVTIEMRHAPFFGWIHDLSAVDPTNVFNLFGLIPFDPTQISGFLHLGAWPLIMGVTMFLQQQLNPAPPDPVQARLFKFMPIVFTFMLAKFPAGLVIYWSWNNLLSIGQQWLIQRQARLPRPDLART